MHTCVHTVLSPTQRLIVTGSWRNPLDGTCCFDCTSSQSATVRTWRSGTCVCGCAFKLHALLVFCYRKALWIIAEFTYFQTMYMHPEQNMNTFVCPYELRLHLLPKELWGKWPTLITAHFPGYTLVCWQRGKCKCLILNKIFFTKNHAVFNSLCVTKLFFQNQDFLSFTLPHSHPPPQDMQRLTFGPEVKQLRPIQMKPTAEKDQTCPQCALKQNSD